MTQWNLDGAADAVLPARDAERSVSNFERERALPARTAEAPIGVFDSGAGGLTILTTLRQELPHENYIYIGDTAHVPYGQRSDGEIVDLSIASVRFLVEQGAKLVVVACNTASQAALNTLRATFNIPIVGVVPAVKPAARATRKGRVGVAATNQAAKAAYLQHLIDEFAEGIQVYAIGCPELVALVEAGIFDGPEAEQTVRQALQPLLAADVDVIVLGCTHFPAMRPLIERVVGQHIQVIDSGAAIARRTRSVLDAEGLMHPAGGPGRVDIWCSGDPIAFTRVASKLLGDAVIAHQTTIIPAP
jgi:glutamate racemase